MKHLRIVLFSLLWPAAAHACAVCGALNDRNRAAFFGTTILLSLVPLGMIGGGVWWLRRTGSAFDAEDLIDRDAIAPPPPAPGAAAPNPPERPEPRQD